MSDAWYYADGDRQTGPVSSEQLRTFLQSPRGGKNTLVWRQGFSDWRPAGALTELSPAFDGPPPLPQGAIPPQVAPAQKESLGRRILGIAAAIGGALIGTLAVRAFGGLLLWPAALIGISWLILWKCKVEPAGVPMLAVLIGHTGWMIVGHIYLYAMGALTLEHISGVVDIVAVIGLTIWFLIRPSRAAAIGVLVYQCLALSAGVAFSGDISIPGIGGQALSLGQWLHYLLRGAGIALAIYAIAELGKKPSPASAVSP